MRIAYRMGWPFGRMLAALGVPTLIRIRVIRDDEAGVFVGHSPDVRGLVVEADSLGEIAEEARLLLPDLLGAANSLDRSQTTMRVLADQPAA